MRGRKGDGFGEGTAGAAQFDQAADLQVKAQYEWFAAFGILLTILWLYLEILRLLAKLRKR